MLLIRTLTAVMILLLSVAPAFSGACDDYAKCCDAFIETLEKMEDASQEQIEQMRQSCAGIEQIKDPQAKEMVCKQIMDVFKQYAEDYEEHGFEWPDECR